MERLGLLLLLSHCITSSAANTILSVLKTSGKSSTTFPVDVKETTVFTTKSALGPNFNFTLSSQGKIIKSGTCDKCYQGSVWVPLFMITNGIGKSKYLDPFSIPKDMRPLNEIDLSVESKAEMEWQIFTLPMENDDSTKTYIGNHVISDLPEDEEVWLACRSKNGRAISIPLQLKAGNEPILDESNINVKREWSFIRIYEHKIDFGDTNSKLKESVRKGRSLHLGFSPNSPLQYQVFAVPLRPKDIITPIAISVVVVFLLLLAASYLCYRCFLKKKSKDRHGGNAA